MHPGTALHSRRLTKDTCFAGAHVRAAVVFDMHYNELLLKNEEIERLKTVIEGLGGGS